MNNFTKLMLARAMTVKVEASALVISPMDLCTNVHIKKEPVGVAEEEVMKMEEPDLYADHEIKEELVIGPVVLQPTDLAQARYMQNTSDGLNVDTERPYKCDTETKCYTGKYHLKRHKITRTGEKPNQNLSTQTQKELLKLKSKSDIKHHMVHTEEKPYKCDRCNKGFAFKYHLNAHSKIHVKKKPHKCAHCNKGFVSKSQLNTHLMIHTGEKPHMCDICNKCFIRKYELKCHIMGHTGEKPYKCDLCNKGYVFISSYNKHLRTHTGEKPYMCDICNKCFITKYELKCHIMGHNGEKLYKCDLCNKEYVSKSSYNRHLRTHT